MSRLLFALDLLGIAALLVGVLMMATSGFTEAAVKLVLGGAVVLLGSQMLHQR